MGAQSESRGMILKLILKKRCEAVNWINMPQDRCSCEHGNELAVSAKW
jgi:hypothetical protein